MRLEEFFQDRFRGLSKLYLRDLVKGEKCEVNGRYENIGYRLRPDDFVEIVLIRRGRMQCFHRIFRST